MKKIIAASLLLATVSGTAQAMALVPVDTGDKCHHHPGCRRMRPGLASWPQWRLPAQFRRSRGARLPAQLSHRPRRRMPRQREGIFFDHLI
jgi:hypothetical protein